jgi:hypothetical protein
MDNLWAIVSGAPWWVYVLFVVLVSLGIKATRPRTLPISRLVLLPLIFVVWSFFNLYPWFVGEMSLLLFWVVFLAVGAYFGIREVRNWKITKDHHKRTVTIPGNRSTLVLIVLIFVLKFYWGYYYATHTTISYSMNFWDVATSAIVTGFVVGRAWFFFRCYQSKS